MGNLLGKYHAPRKLNTSVIHFESRRIVATTDGYYISHPYQTLHIFPVDFKSFCPCYQILPWYLRSLFLIPELVLDLNMHAVIAIGHHATNKQSIKFTHNETWHSTYMRHSLMPGPNRELSIWFLPYNQLYASVMGFYHAKDK